MTIGLYDEVLLNSGEKVHIIEIFERGKIFLADFDRSEDLTNEITIDDIDRVIHACHGTQEPTI